MGERDNKNLTVEVEERGNLPAELPAVCLEKTVVFPEEIIIPGFFERDTVRKQIVEIVKQVSEADLLVLPLYSAWMAGYVLEACARTRGLPFPPRVGLRATSQIISNFEEKRGMMLEEYTQRIKKETIFPLPANGDEKIIAFYFWLEKEAARKGSLVDLAIAEISEKAVPFKTRKVIIADDVYSGVTLGMLVPFEVRKAVPQAEIKVIDLFPGRWLEELLIETFKNISLELDIYSPEFCILRKAIRGGVQEKGNPRKLKESDFSGSRYDSEKLKGLHPKAVAKLQEYGRRLASDSSLWG